jgi:hypothetical protein
VPPNIAQGPVPPRISAPDLGLRGANPLPDLVATALRLGGGTVIARAGADERLYSERLYAEYLMLATSGNSRLFRVARLFERK